MLYFIIYSVLIFILAMLIWMTYHFRALSNEPDSSITGEGESEIYKNKLLGSHNFIYAAIILVIITLLVFTYLVVKGTPMEGHVMEWLNIVVRVMHITFGIAWIGASFYFVFLENALNRTENVRDELAGNLWAIHGGGFYYLEKYKTAPKSIPKHLHWFKYEAYFTWISGFSLLFIVYYFNAKGFLIDTNVFKMSSAEAIVTGIGSFVVAWLLYDILCKTSLIKKGILFTITGVIIAIAFAWFYSYVFSARAAYIHFGAMLGSIMVANVFFVIIPSQKAMVKAAREDKPLNPKLGKHAGLRSLHNNYLTLPVIFTMVSNHFPSTFGHKYQWLILAAISLASAGIKHWLNLREQGKYSVWVMPVSVLVLLATAYVTAPPKPGECKTNINFIEVNAIVQSRCISCHSSKPTDDLITAPPNGVTYDTPDNIVRLKDKIMQRVVLTKTMPQNNKTNMTLEERELIRCWIEQGASLK
ncbi:MAG TPA: urate hydroxylase PuuD [Chitinophagaceae bacterium]|nr:urate hydroxylase PuuD [Chitinophagaceae bacterium]